MHTLLHCCAIADDGVVLQCAAPDLAITSGVLGIVVIVGAWFSYMLPGDCLCFSTSMACTVLTCLLGITTARRRCTAP